MNEPHFPVKRDPFGPAPIRAGQGAAAIKFVPWWIGTAGTRTMTDPIQPWRTGFVPCRR